MSEYLQVFHQLLMLLLVTLLTSNTPHIRHFGGLYPVKLTEVKLGWWVLYLVLIKSLFTSLQLKCPRHVLHQIVGHKGFGIFSRFEIILGPVDSELLFVLHGSILCLVRSALLPRRHHPLLLV